MVQVVLRTIEIPQLLVDKVVDAFVTQVVQVSPGRSVPWLRIAKTVDFPQLQFTNKVVYIPVVVQKSIPMVWTVQQALEIPLFLFDKMIDVPVVQGRAGFWCKSSTSLS